MGKSKASSDNDDDIFSYPLEKPKFIKRKALDILNALRYIKEVVTTNKGDSKMDDKTKKSKKLRRLVAAAVAAPFIALGVSKVVTSNIPYAEYVIGALVAAFVVWLVVED